MRPPKQKQAQVKKGLCRVLEHVDVDVNVNLYLELLCFLSFVSLVLRNFCSGCCQISSVHGFRIFFEL